MAHFYLGSTLPKEESYWEIALGYFLIFLLTILLTFGIVVSSSKDRGPHGNKKNQKDIHVGATQR